MSPNAAQGGRSIGAIVFDLVLVAFCGTLVLNALGLRPGVGSVPLLVGIPTLAAALILLALDVFPRARQAVDPGTESGGILGMLEPLDADDAAAADDPAARRRQLGFTLWTVAFVLLAAFTSFYVAIPVALVALLVAIRLNWLAIVLVVAGTLAGFYGLFDLFLNVRL